MQENELQPCLGRCVSNPLTPTLSPQSRGEEEERRFLRETGKRNERVNPRNALKTNSLPKECPFQC
jgi:hypothetical protein